jgi:hypothetical protein
LRRGSHSNYGWSAACALAGAGNHLPA